MGYDVYITRASDWMESQSAPILREEWVRIVEEDAELGPDPENGPDDFLYVAHPEEPASLWWKVGVVFTKDPDRYTIRKMIELACRLGAGVQGEDWVKYSDWERYDQDRAAAWPNAPLRRLSLLERLFRALSVRGRTRR